MSFVSLGGDGSLRPTFFELIAADRIIPSVKAAAIYSLSVLSQRRQFFHRVLVYEDEVLGVLAYLLERLSLRNSSATFAESLYGLRRAPSEQSKSKPSHLSNRQCILALLGVVGLPYAEAKLEKLYKALSSSQTQHEGAARLPAFSQGNEAHRLDLRSQRLHTIWKAVKRWMLLLFLKGYPLLRCVSEGLNFVYQLLYLLDASRFHAPINHLINQQVVRVSAQEQLESEQAKLARRRQQVTQARSRGRFKSLLSLPFLHAGYLVADHTRNALLLLVVGFKLLEWWFVSAEQKIGSQKHLPVPPPPPPIGPHPDGIALPKSTATCPLCRKQRTNPAMVGSSGYVYCYPCIFYHVSRHGYCPVSRIPASIDHLRRLYQSQ